MESEIQKAVEMYKCPGCVNGSSIECGSYKNNHDDCNSHCPGTFMIPIGSILLGMPKGFNRAGPINLQLWKGFSIYDKESFVNEYKQYNELNIPVWKYLDEHGNTIVRGIQPRINCPFIHVLLGNLIDEINCFEITEKYLETID
jgi:hypothetical protein